MELSDDASIVKKQKIVRATSSEVPIRPAKDGRLVARRLRGGSYATVILNATQEICTTFRERLRINKTTVDQDAKAPIDGRSFKNSQGTARSLALSTLTQIVCVKSFQFVRLRIKRLYNPQQSAYR